MESNYEDIYDTLFDDRCDVNFYIQTVTPDQEYVPYVQVMKTGPLLLLFEISKHNNNNNSYFGACFWIAIAKSSYYHLLIQRLLRLIARESLQTNDGKNLGPMARHILCHNMKS
eukprot:CAMPEP_0170816180 /NCGR_PEP_ID=MMETSP0733-20121128/39047_1 /TAXON_ID=186038 /ORGANISM="Fragilariopsis kerguelensis, Strain L26-C5" /LENGTH=113 /DNA_ID=CAMNT_0011175173 /DNA_START=1 /DNA_END=338 /DNA_ORIENTATION=-